MVKVSIEFDRPSGMYYAGEIISGTVALQLSDNIDVKEVTLRLDGKCNVHWTERNESKQSMSDVYNASETYLDILLKFVESECTLPAGSHKYQFSTQLPATLPQTMKGLHGYIVYSAEARVVRVMKMDDVVEKTFIINGVLDMDTISKEFKGPTCLSQSEAISCCCFLGGNIEVDVKLNNRCFVPGNSIVIGGQLTNHSNTAIKKVTAQLTEYTAWTGTHNIHTRTDQTARMMVTSSRKINVPAGGEGCFEDLKIVVPSASPSNNPGCNIIKVNYKLKVFFDIFFNSFCLETDIIIGTEPPNHVPTPGPMDYPDVDGVPFEKIRRQSIKLVHQGTD